MFPKGESSAAAEDATNELQICHVLRENWHPKPDLMSLSSLGWSMVRREILRQTMRFSERRISLT
jgi:hypothetical protein